MILLLFLITIDARYHTFSEVAHELDSIANNFSAIAYLDTIGFSTVDSMPIFAFKISDNVSSDEDEPAVLYIACHHAEEILGIELCMYMINDLIQNYENDSCITHWINNREIWFVPLLNPEGHMVVMKEIDTTWRKNKRDNNNNGTFDLDYDGVDPNRNYDFYWSNGGSSDPSSEYYRGPGPFSEKEALAIRDLCKKQYFTLCNTYHSARTGLGEVVYFPWKAGTYYPPDFFIIRQIADSISKLIVNDAGNGHYMALAGSGVDGRARNWLYGIWNIYSYCIEISTTTIQPGWMVDDICERNLVGAYYLLDRVGRGGITGCIYDTLTGEPLSAEVRIANFHDELLPPRLSEPRYGRFLRILVPGTYNIEIFKSGYKTKTINDIEVDNNRYTEVNVYLEKIEGSQNVLEMDEKLTTYPNPVQNALIIQLSNPFAFSAVKIYDVTGRLLRNYSDPISPYLYWLCDDDYNRKVSNGIYYILGQAEEKILIKKVIVFN